MGISGEHPAGRPPVDADQVELLHDSDRTRAYRLHLPGHRTVVVKQPLGPDALKRLKHETAILRRLRGAQGVVQVEPTPVIADALVLQDGGGATMDRRPMPLPPGEALSVAAGLADALAAVHRRHVVHRDICPGKIVLTAAGGVLLIDFELASTFAEIRPEFAHHNEIVGTLPYLAPEQTGRTGRPVDQRADLYSLGATMYEMVTGEPPFGTGDPLRLSHAHLARVPVPPAEVGPEVPAALSDVIMHLLEKEPDNRYQTAEGLAYDLGLLRAAAPGETVALRVGAGDVPLRLLPQSRIIGRDPEIRALGAAFADAMTGLSHGLLVSGPAGVGKTSLVDELRPIASGSSGWFVSGKFDQHRRDIEFDGARQAIRALGRLLLAEPEEELADLRQRLRHVLGRNAGLLAAVQPEFALLMGVEPDPTIGDALYAQARMQRIGVDVLTTVASPKRPIVMFVDDVQWATRTTLGFLDMLISEGPPDGLLLVLAYRDDEIDATHPLTAIITRWRQQGVEPQRIALGNLPPASTAELVGDLLQLDATDAEALAEPVAQRTRGNPYDTVELINSLRRSSVLVLGDDGWTWDAGNLSRHLRQANVVDPWTTRLRGLPTRTRLLVEIMACLGGRADMDLLSIADGHPGVETEDLLAPALDEGLLVLEPGEPADAVRFRHDRVNQAILDGLTPSAKSALHLGLARRLAPHPEHAEVAAHQYYAVAEHVHDPDERRRVSALLAYAAEQSLVVSNHAMAERYLAVAVDFADPADKGNLITLQTRRHASLYSLGRLDEADAVYAAIDRLCHHPALHADATLVQVSGLTNQGRAAEAVALGLEMLGHLGFAAPPPERVATEIDEGLELLHRWLDGDTADDLRRPEVTEPELLATAALINRMMAPAFFSNQDTLAWLTLQALRMWVLHGPVATLVGPVAHLTFVTVGRCADYRTGHRALLRVIAVGEARGYEPDTSQARFLYALSTGHWYEPLEDNVQQAQLAREGLLHGGDLQKACHTYYVSVYELLDYAPTLDGYLTEVDAGLAFATRTGNDQSTDVYLPYRRLAGMLRGEPAAADSGADPLPEALAGNPVAVSNVHVTRALAAALLDDMPALHRHIEAATALLPVNPSTYPVAQARLLRGLDLAEQARTGPAKQRAARLAELDEAVAWFAARAADAPVNFSHTLLLLQAERAWAGDDFQTAAQSYDAAQHEVAGRGRPWHRALALERAARFYLAHGMQVAGTSILNSARHAYHTWGAAAKVAQLDRIHPSAPWLSGLRPPTSGQVPDASPQAPLLSGTIDLLAILAASQALSSQTTFDGVRARVVDVLSEMTGATAVHLLLWDDDRQRWTLPTSPPNGERPTVPASVIRYVERTREPLVVGDATRDDRFSRDPYFGELGCCSLLVVPIVNRGTWQALLVLENHLIREAFSAERLDAVRLVAGQLAVSLDNASVYASLERKVSQRTEELTAANRRLELLSTTDALTALANRRRLEEILHSEWESAQRTGRPLALAMVDIDHFKLYNDHYGHPAGDECLQRVAAVLTRNLRDGDLVARYGGEEFAVVMPGLDTEAARRTAERLRLAVSGLAEPHVLARSGIVTVSIGVAAMMPRPDRDPDDLVGLADVELYRAKRNGRDQVRAAVVG
ncbi:diguanylate cyclase [Catellatospora sichuanensis]|uniref:diguanylate cyclase n=1 Tax=Catellatospora sichuanensis TaxID=1969805 RepID=UPI001181DF7D|nr:diguanylate cyclase [Catellatospora sichuanensis]